MHRRKPLAEQVIVITGASSGIGLLTARSAAAAGAHVFLVSRSADALAAATRQIGERASYAVADVGNEAEVQAAAAAAIAQFGRIDTWVNNAGVAIYAPLLETPEDEHQRLFQTNYFGAVHGARAAVPHLRETEGTLITVGSIVSDLPSPVMGAYAASKHAIKGYVDSLRIELNAAGAPVAVVLVKPAGMATPIAQHAANHGQGEAKIPPPVYDPAIGGGRDPPDGGASAARDHRRRDRGARNAARAAFSGRAGAVRRDARAAVVRSQAAQD